MSAPNHNPSADVPSPVSFDRLPNEILHHIFGYLDTLPPSARFEALQAEPNFSITKSDTKSLKAVSLTSKHWRSVSVPILFKHSQFIIPKDDLNLRLSQVMKPFFDFITSKSLQAMNSFTLICHKKQVTDSPAGHHRVNDFADFWIFFFQVIDPVDLLIVAPPEALGRLTSCRVYLAYEKSFECECQYLRLQRIPGVSAVHQPGANIDRGPKAVNEYEAEIEAIQRESFGILRPLIFHSQRADFSSLFSIRPWENLLLNEGSFIKAYNEINFDHMRFPSILPDLVGEVAQADKALLSPTIRDMSYIAMFPAQTHFFALVRNLPRLDRLYTQIVPPNQVLRDLHRMGIRQELLWMERNSAYAFLMQDLFHSPARGNFCYLKVLESGDQADRRSWEMAAQFISRRRRGWKLVGDGVLVKNTEIRESPKGLEDIHNAHPMIFDAELVRWAWNGTANLPISTQPIYRRAW
ncbi:hypothetical protein VTL71DRAFT_12785 [Oculimacula yallundae]|uniref:F-box domain-containing protein n=1 Tax=Oculimacula yallundae TaxID=86028 RepID=A0ABR4CNS1_9HELO